MTLKKQIIWSAVVGVVITFAISGYATLRGNQYMSELQQQYEVCASNPANACPMYVVGRGLFSFPMPAFVFGVVWFLSSVAMFVILRIVGKIREKHV